MASKNKVNYLQAVGRRKRAVARVRLIKGREPITVNGRPAAGYFTGKAMEQRLLEPLRLAGLETTYTATVKVTGSGIASQLEAVVHGLARAVVRLDDGQFKPPLKSAGLLRRDSRKKQRRMVGTGGKARRKKQSPKR